MAVAVGLRTAASGTVTGIEETSMRALAKLEQVLPARLRRRVRAARVVHGAARLTGRADGRRGRARDDRGRVPRPGAAPVRLSRLRRASRAVRTVEPHRLVQLARRWYLVAWDVGRDDWRSFRVDRITTRLSVGTRFPAASAPPGGAVAFVASGAAAARDRWQAKVILHGSKETVAARVPQTVRDCSSRSTTTRACCTPEQTGSAAWRSTSR